MYAIFISGGKQYRVSEGEVVRLEKLNFEVGKIIVFKQILIIVNSSYIKMGTPFINTAQITAKINVHGRSRKVNILKFNRRKHYKKKLGHRQWFTDIKIIKINNQQENINHGT